MAYNDHFPNSAAVSAGRPAIADALLNPRFVYDLATRHARRIGSTAVVLFIVFASLILLMTPHYSGTAIVLVDSRQQRVLQSDAVLSGIGNDMAAVDSQVEVIQSAPIALKVISELKLDQDPEFLPANGIFELLRSIVGDRSESRMQYVLSRFASNLKVRRRGVTYILEIEFLSRSPEKAARIANAIANAYVDQQAAAKSSATSDASKWLGDRLADLRKQARDAEAAVALYKAEKGLVNTGEKRSVVEQQLADTNQQLTLARLRVEETRARLKQIEKASSNPAAKNSLVDALSSPVIAALRAQYTLAAKNSAELAQSLGPLHPAIRTSEAELSAISRQIDMEIGRLSLGVRQEFETAQERERSLEASLGKLKTVMASNDQSTVRLHELERESEAAQAILQRSLARYKETKEQEGVQAVEVRVISPAAVPLAPT
ncbi:MAG: GumC family protein, partial [Afipia sp.]|nr:GumC family protein [Afipia sp.]